MRKIDTLLNSLAPDVVYHYTDANGLLGILRTGSIWSSSAYHLNDTGEFRYALALIAERLKERIARTSSSTSQRLISASEYFQSPSASHDLQAYVASFSRESDLLSQWLAYTGEQDTGYAIGLRPAHFAEVKRQGYALIECIYERDQQLDLAEAVVDVLAEPMHAGDEEQAIKHAQKALLAASAMKHPGFCSEREWRLVKILATGFENSKEVKFRSGRNGIVPHLVAPLVTQNELFAPVSIVIGPKSDMTGASAAIATLLDSMGLFSITNSPVRVMPSKTPYRP